MWTSILEPVNSELVSLAQSGEPGPAGQWLHIHSAEAGVPELVGLRIAFFSIGDDRGHVENKGCSFAGDAIRRSFYPLFTGQWSITAADLGHLPAGATLTDTHTAVQGLVAELLQRNIIPFLLGPTKDFAYSVYRAYDGLEQSVNMALIDNRIDFGTEEDALASPTFLGHVILDKPHNLFNLSLIGLQAYFVAPDRWDLAERMHFETYRLGQLRGSISEVEPAVRDADTVVFDNRSLRHADAPGHCSPSPNGFTADEACAVARYCGLSDKVSSFGYYEYNPTLDLANQNAHLIGQVAWYFIEGVQLRRGDYPLTPKKNYLRFTVLMDDDGQELVFYKSPLSERWWMEGPLRQTQYSRHTMVPCTAEDYQRALEGDIPTRWWKAQRKGL